MKIKHSELVGAHLTVPPGVTLPLMCLLIAEHSARRSPLEL